MMKIYTYLSLPALLIHELSHILFGFLCGYTFDLKQTYVTKNEDGSFHAGLIAKKNKETILQSFLVSLSPLYVVLGIAILSFFNPIFIGILIYFIITYIYSFPSKEDFVNVRYAKVFAKYNYYDPEFVRFMRIKGVYKDDEGDFGFVELDTP